MEQIPYLRVYVIAKATLASESVLAMSTSEAELIVLCAYAADVAYCRKIDNELGFLQLRPTVIDPVDAHVTTNSPLQSPLQSYPRR